MRKNLFTYSLLLSLFTFFTVSSYSQEEKIVKEPFIIGILGGYGPNFHNADFTTVPGCPSCNPGFDNNVGSGFQLGLSGEYLINNPFWAYLKLGLLSLNSVLKNTEPTYVIVGNSQVPGQFQFIEDASLTSFKISPGVAYNLYPGFNLNLGLDFDILVKNFFHQYEQITQPADQGVFVETNTRIRNDISGNLNNTTKPIISLAAGINYELPMNINRTLLLVPELDYSYPFNNLTNNLTWKVQTLRLGVGVKWNPERIILPKIDTIYHQETKHDTVIISSKLKPKDIFKPGIELLVDKSSTREGNTIINKSYYRITDTLLTYAKPELKASIKATDDVLQIHSHFVREAFPVLNMVFFDKNSTNIDNKYYNQVSSKDFSLANLDINPLVYHKNILNIAGNRLQENPRAKITITGYIDTATEKGGHDLAHGRAVSVKNYICENWGIEPNRITIVDAKPPYYPKNPTISANEDGYSENRRVVIEADNPIILNPIPQQKYVSVDKEPAVLTFDPIGSTNDNIESWNLKITNDKGDKIADIDGTNNLSLIKVPVTDNIAKKMGKGTLNISLTVKDKDGSVGTASDILPVKKDTSTIETEKLSLIIFQVSSNELSANAKQSIRDFLKNLTKNDTLIIKGYTDYLGIPDDNKALSERRASAVCNFISRELKSKANISSCEGMGSGEFPRLIESYNTQAERYLSRTVVIEVRRKE
jgi:outer membrane protein OmpA-like peptidoglycan-associated protein